MAVLLTAYGKSLIYQALALLMDYIVAGGHPTENKSVVLVVSPLNALKEFFLNFRASILKPNPLSCKLDKKRME